MCVVPWSTQQPLAAPVTVLWGSSGDRQSGCVASSPSTPHLQVQLAAGAARESQAEPKQKEWGCSSASWAANGAKEGAWNAQPHPSGGSHVPWE